MPRPNRFDRIQAQQNLASLSPEERERLLKLAQLAAQSEEIDLAGQLDKATKAAIRAETERLLVEEPELQPKDSIKRAAKSVLALYGQPLQTSFDADPSPRVFPAPAKPTERSPLRPQTDVGAYGKKEIEVASKVDRAFPGVNGDVPAPQLHALRAMWAKIAEETPQATGEQLQVLFRDEMESLDETMEGKGKIIRQDPQQGPASPMGRAFLRQITPGEIPDLSPAQRAYIQTAAEKQLELDKPNIEADVRENFTRPVTRVVRGEGVTVDRKPTEDEIQEEIVRRVEAREAQTPWYMTDEKESVLADMESNVKGGYGFKKTYPTGAVVEGPVHYVFRTFLAPVNAGVAAIGSVLEDVGGVPKDRSERPKVYQEDSFFSDVGFNVATNRSATEEIGDMWKAVEGTKAWAPVGYGAGFIADLLIPLDFGLVKGVKGAKGAYKVSKMSKALTGTTDWVGAAKYAGRSMFSDVPVLRHAVSGPGDIRLLVGAETGRSLVGYRVFREALLQEKDLGKALKRVGKVIGEDASFIKQAKRFDNADDALAFFAKQDGFIKASDEIEATVRDMGKIARGSTKPGGTAAKDIQRWIKILAKSEGEVEALLKGKKGLNQMLEAIWSNQQARSALIKQIAWEKGVIAAADITKDVQGIARDLVMLTPRTFAEAKKMPDILAMTGETPIGKLAKKIANRSKEDVLDVTDVTDMYGNPGWKLTKDESLALSKAIRGYEEAGLITPRNAGLILSYVEEDAAILTKDLRVIVEAEIDLTAQRMKATLTDKAVGKLSAEVQTEIVQPIETRSLTSGWFNRNVLSKFKKFPVADKEVPLLVRTELRRLTQQVGSLDQKLRTDIRKLMKPKSEFRKVYGFTPDEVITSDQAITSLILGPKRWRVAESNIYLTALDFFALYMKKTPSIGAIFRPNTYSRSGSFLSAEGKLAIEDFLIKKIGGGQLAHAQPTLDVGNFDKQLDLFLQYMKKGLEENPSWLAKSLHGQGSEAGFRFLGADKMPELKAALYYQLEARRLSKEAIERIAINDPIHTTAPPILEEALMIAERDFVDLLNKEFMGVVPAGNIYDDYAGASEWYLRLLSGKLSEHIGRTAGLKPSGYIRGSDWEDILELMVPPTAWIKGDVNIDNVVAALTPEMKRYLAFITEHVDDSIEGIISRNRLASTNIADDLETVEKRLIAMETGKKSHIDILFDQSGEDTLRLGYASDKLIHDAFLSSKKITGLHTYIEALIAKEDYKGADATLSFIGNQFRRLQALRYHVMLGWRPRFHGANLVTAPLILGETLGHEVAMRSMAQVPSAAKTIAIGINNPASPQMSKIIVVDKAGRSWTRGEIFEKAISEGALRSQTSFQLHADVMDAAIEEAKVLLPTQTFARFNRYVKAKAGIPLELAAVEDNVWRMSTIIDSLKQGESMEVALQKGRVSMFDYGKLSTVEKWIATRLALFYTFQRMNITHTINNVLNHPNRVKNALMVTKDITRMVSGEDADEILWYAPEWAQSRPILDYARGMGKEPYYVAGPATVTVEAAVTVIESLVAATQLDVPGFFEPLLSALSPEIKLITGDEGFGGGKEGVLPPIDVAMLKFPGSWDAFAAIIGEYPQAVPADIGESTVDGSRWIVSPKAWERYRSIKKLSTEYVGLTTVLSDYVKMFGSMSDRLEGRKVSASIPEILGVETKISASDPAIARQRAIQAQLRKLAEEKKLKK